MRLSAIVEASDALRRTRSRKQKVGRLAECLRKLGPDELGTGVAYLCGSLPQGRLGVGWAALREAARTEAAAEALIELRAVHAALDELGEVRGAGSAHERARQLGQLFGRASAAEQEFLSRLIGGELRQGASEGLMVEAIAAAAGVESGEVRRAAMLSGDLTEVARAALGAGSAGLARFSIQLFRPVLPMLAQPADGFEQRVRADGGAGPRVQARWSAYPGAQVCRRDPHLLQEAERRDPGRA